MQQLKAVRRKFLAGGKTPFEELFDDILYRKVYTFGTFFGGAAPALASLLRMAMQQLVIIRKGFAEIMKGLAKICSNKGTICNHWKTICSNHETIYNNYETIC